MTGGKQDQPSMQRQCKVAVVGLKGRKDGEGHPKEVHKFPPAGAQA